MTIVTPLPVFGPINAVTPFTYRDNDTFQTQLRGLRDKVNEFIAQLELIDVSMRSDLGAEIDDLTNQLNMQLTTINDIVNDVLAMSPVVLEARVADVEADIAALINPTLTQLARDKFGFPVVAYLPVGVTMATATNAQMHTAFTDACTAAGAGAVILPSTELRIVGSFSMAGFQCSIIGTGSSMNAGYVGRGSSIKAVNQIGPVLDFTGYVWPFDFVARPVFRDFMVSGDNTAGNAKRGMYFPHSDLTTDPYPQVGEIRNIGIQLTGGTGLEMKDCYLCVVDNVVVSTPVECVANNVPYARFVGCNGMRVKMGFRSTQFTAAPHTDMDTPSAGVLRTEPSTLSTDYPFHRASFECWFENFHLATGKTCVIAQTNAVVYNNFMFFDIKKITGATGTSYFRFEISPIDDSGGNIYRGIVEGDFNGAVNSPDYGVDVLQSRNRIEGVKGFRGNNVRLNAGVGYTWVELGGQEGNASTPGILDNSGQTTNSLCDAQGGVWTSYTPVWTAAGTACALGNGTITGAFRRRGDVVDWRVILTPGSTTTFGTGTYSITLPIEAVILSGGPLGSGLVQPNGIGICIGSATTFSFNTGVGLWTNILPATLASGNRCSFSGSYQAKAI